jgi:hypothetical protein
MKLRFEDKNTFYICGYYVETCLDTCSSDISKLQNEFQTKIEILYESLGTKDVYYGLM